MLSRSARHLTFGIVAFVLLACVASPATAQVSDPNRGARLNGGLDLTNAYFFRGLRQDDTGLVFFPFADGSVTLIDGGSNEPDGLAFRLGTWNSLNTGNTGLDGPSGKLWYESDFYGALDFGFGGGFTASAIYTAYVSPNNSFTSVKEFAVRGGINEIAVLGVSLNPYGLLAFELDTAPGIGQSDGGFDNGVYLELGVSPAWTDRSLTVTFPVKVGLSLNDYYELAGVDHPFGYLSLGAVGLLPIMQSPDFGSLALQGSFEFLSLGETPEAFNFGDANQVLFSLGLRFGF